MVLLTGLISIFLVSRNREVQGEKERWGDGCLVEQSEHTHTEQLSLSSYMSAGCGALKQLQ